jgi:lactoylglutathione lyase
MTTITHITGVRAVSIPVDNQDAALQFYIRTLGFTLLRDLPTPNCGRWIEIAPTDTSVILTLEPATPTTARGSIGIRFTTDDIDSAHSTLRERAVETGDILRWPETPAMFAFSDPDGNAFSITATV